MSKSILETRKLTKKFDSKVILKDVDFRVEKGHSIAILGNNGTGKSTLLRMLCGLTPVTDGKIIHDKKLKFSYIPEHFPKINVTADEYIRYMGLIEGVPLSAIEEKAKQLYQLFHLENMLDVPIKHLSKGTIQKVAVIQALLTDPDILLMDEPLSGQDITSQKNFIDLVRRLNQEGLTIIMSCHEQFLVNQLSNKVYTIDHHNLIPIELKKIQNSNYDIIVLEAENGRIQIPEGLLPFIIHKDYEGRKLSLVTEKENSNTVIIQMLLDGHVLKEMKGLVE